ncbi:GTP binding protein 3, mitochondrial [Rhinolophus ferrumequinum]|uniref:GTP binding protein 3, mitochondrial n=1 Tax=Rhinolophus ferrumequinum TaxID=59479 RepID=A0A7J7U0G4_RHIFE|nr:GTP binding protein 3, mitochondrial [Rhinolophus ferrumequinum]
MWRGLLTLVARATVHAPGQPHSGPRIRGHHFRAEFRPRPLRHRCDSDQRPRQRPRPPKPHGAPGLAPGSQGLPAPTQRPPLRGAVGPRASAVVPRSPEFHG